MNNTTLYALDFDGVICDSAIETGITGWKAASQIWRDMHGDMAPENLVEQFRQVRPIIETGYEAILAMRLLFQQVSTGTILSDFSELKQQALAESGKDTDELKQLFGNIRDTWIQDSLDEWVAMNPLFSGVADKLRELDQHGSWFIVTTKQERFVTQILQANNIELATNRIFGLDRKMTKVEVLKQLLAEHPQSEINFVEDRLPTLLNVLAVDQLTNIQLYLADWGYNTDRDIEMAKNQSIKIIGIGGFLV